MAWTGGVGEALAVSFGTGWIFQTGAIFREKIEGRVGRMPTRHGSDQSGKFTRAARRAAEDRTDKAFAAPPHGTEAS